MGEETPNRYHTNDPLHLLPSEVVLRILDYAPISSLATLLRLNKPWKHFIDQNQELIYTDKTQHPPGAKDFSFLSQLQTFSRYFEGVTSWKELCKRQTLLGQNWRHEHPETRQTGLYVGADPVWRFRPDFKRRFFLSTSQGGGLFVTDLDTGQRLWSLDGEVVRAFAHLEYQDGTAVWDREGNALEVWRTDLDGLRRGEFRQVAVLPHVTQTRGFQLSHNTLCVVSSEGAGYLYDMQGTPTLKKRHDIEPHAVGHLDQGPEVVVYSLGTKGYHFFDKASGRQLGILNPRHTDEIFHIVHPASKSGVDVARFEGNGIGRTGMHSIAHRSRDQTTPIHLERGPHPPSRSDSPFGPRAPGMTGLIIALKSDEWGAGMLNGDLFVGISRGGRTLVCPNWRKALSTDQGAGPHFSIVECDSDGLCFDLGGWLSVRNHRIMFEIQNKVYVLGLTDTNELCVDSPRPSFAFATSLNGSLATPVSFMALYDDCIMTTFTTLRARRTGGVVPTKIIRVLSLAPTFGTEQPSTDSGLSPDDSIMVERLINSGFPPFVVAALAPEQLEEALEELESESMNAEIDDETELDELD